MLSIVLYEPEIAPNTGNIIRLCAVSGAQLHIVEPTAFSFDDKKLKRAGLDYHALATVRRHANWDDCKAAISGKQWWAFTVRGQGVHSAQCYDDDAVLVFGPETRGLPATVLAEFLPEHTLRIPMIGLARSMNLANAVSIALYEAWRQNDYRGSGVAMQTKSGA